MKLKLAVLTVSVASVMISPAADLYWRTDGTTGGNWRSSYWNADASNTDGGTGWTSGANAFFDSSSTLTFATTAVGNVTVSAGSTVTVTAGQTLTLGGVRTFDIGSGASLIWRSQDQSAAVGNEGAGIIKNGAGILDWGAGPGPSNARFNGGFTLNAGTVIVTGTGSFGTGPMSINGGILQSSGSNTFLASSLNIGGDFTFSGTGSDIWSGPTALGASTRTITNSTSSGSRVLSGLISGGSGAGLAFTGSGAGKIYVSNASNSFSGPVTITGGEVGFANDGSLGSGNSVIINGGRLTSSDTSGAAVTSTWSSIRGIQVGDSAANGINIAGSAGSLTYDGVISDLSGTVGTWTKEGDGALYLGGDNTYSGATTVAAGMLVIDGAQSGGGLISVESGATFGGAGSTAGSLHFDAGAKFLFNATNTFTVDGLNVTFDGFSITDLVGLSSAVNAGTYTLIDGPAVFDFTNVSNFGVENAYDLGGGKSAYFQAGSFEVVIVPEPSIALLGGLSVLGLLRRRRA